MQVNTMTEGYCIHKDFELEKILTERVRNIHRKSLENLKERYSIWSNLIIMKF